MSKSKLRGIIGTAITAVIIGLLILVIVLINSKSNKSVNVYQVKDLSMSSQKESGTTKGKVTNSMSQTVKLNNDEKVAEIYVKTGDKVKVGDKLFTYDLRSLNIELKNKKLQVEQANVSIYNANLELEKLKKTEPTEDKKTDNSDDSTTNNKLNSTVNGAMIPYKGNGTSNNPYTYLIESGAAISANYMKARCIKRAENRYEVLEYREDDKFKGVLIYATQFVFKKDGTFDFTLSQTENGFNISPGVDENYTQSELSYQINLKQIEISNYKIDKSIAENEYAKTKNKIKNSTVHATAEGTVKAVRSADNAKTTGNPLIEIVGKSGYYVEGYISELQLSEVSKGSIVKIKNVADNVDCEGVIVAVSKYPSDDADVEATGNTNVSYYPFTVSVSSNENLKIGDEAEINLSQKSDNIKYILKSFIIQEDDGNYVYIADGDGVLEKKLVNTGSTLYGEYIEINSGLTDTDWLAFPYEKGIKTGLKTVQSTQEELFGDMY